MSQPQQLDRGCDNLWRISQVYVTVMSHQHSLVDRGIDTQYASHEHQRHSGSKLSANHT